MNEFIGFLIFCILMVTVVSLDKDTDSNYLEP